MRKNPRATSTLTASITKANINPKSFAMHYKRMFAKRTLKNTSGQIEPRCLLLENALTLAFHHRV